MAYYRHSAEIGQENSVAIRQDNVVAFAKRHDIEIIHEFADRGKSGLNAEGRPAFNEMMDWVRTRDDFVLVFVVGAEGRLHPPFQPLRPVSSLFLNRLHFGSILLLTSGSRRFYRNGTPRHSVA